MSRGHDWILTRTGRMFYPLDPRPDEIDIQDIAHALSQICRFTGHTSEFYSVAQHSVLVSRQVSDQWALWGLLHDASEAYVCDIARPIKRTAAFEGYRAIERRIMDAVCLRFGLGREEPAAVREADICLLYAEARDLMVPHPSWEWETDPYAEPIVPWSPREAKALFLETFETLVIR